MKETNETNEVTLEQARNRLGQLVIAAGTRGEETVITRYGKPFAKITPVTETVVWSVVTGPAPHANAVEPAAADVEIPAHVLQWAEAHGLSVDEPDIYILVAPEDEADEIDGEIAWCRGEVTSQDMAAIRRALAEREAERGGYR